MNAKPIDKEQIFNRAAEIANPAERAAYLDETCSGNGSLRAEIEALLRHDNDAGSFLEHPADEFLATIASRAFETVYEDAVGVNLDFLQHSEKPGCLGTLDAYSVVDVVGYGGMGIVLRAHDAKLNRVVAIKVMAPELAANATAVKRFLREAQAVAAISHDHVVTIHAINDMHRPPYLVMEFIDGQSLQEKIDRCGALPLTEILRIGMQMARGLAAAHEQGLVHRDIKPANILLENGVERVKITDFGLARAVDDVGITQTGEIAGTPQYMSPEQAQGHPIDERSDLFSLGSVLYTMSTGRPAFRANTSVAMLRRITDDTPHSICELNNDIPDWFEAIIFELLAKDPAKRFRSAREVGDLLSGHLAHLQNPATVPRLLDVAPVVAGSRRQAKQSTSDPATRRWPSASILGPVMLVVMLLLSWVFLFWRTVDRGTLEIVSDDPSVTVQIGRPIRDTPEGGFDMNIVERAQGAGIVKLPSGPYRLVCNSRGFIVTPGLFVLGRGERVVVKVRRVPPGAHSFDNEAAPFCRYLTDGPSRMTSVAVSPDGRYVAAGDVAGALMVWNIDGPVPLWSQSVVDPQGTGTAITDVAFTPDGRGILTGSEDSTVRLKDAKTGRELHRFVGHTGWVSALAVSRDGKRLVTGGTWYAHHHRGRDVDNTLRLWELATAKEIRRLDDPGWAVKDVAFSPDGLFVVAGGESHTAGIWDVESGKQVTRLNTPRNLHSVAFAPDGRTVATGHMAAARKEGKFYDPENCVAILWDSTSGQEVRRFIGHSAPINSIAFSTDGKLLATGSGGGSAADGFVAAFDNTVRVWNVANGEELEQFDVGSNVNAVAFTPDGQYVLSAGGRRADQTTGTLEEGDLRRWRLITSLNPPKAALTDEQRLQGKWVPTSGYSNGKELTVEELAEFTFHVDGGVVEVRKSDEVVGKIPFRIDSSTSPKQIDFSVPDVEGSLPGIFEFDGDRLKLAMVTGVFPRPTGFSPRHDPDHLTAIFEQAAIDGQRAAARAEQSRGQLPTSARDNAAGLTVEQRLQGKWAPVSGSIDGKKITVEGLARISFRFYGIGVELTGEHGESGKVLFKVDADHHPMHIDLITPDGKYVSLGIFEFDGDRLNLELGDEHGTRPTEFDPADKPNHLSAVCERVPDVSQKGSSPARTDATQNDPATAPIARLLGKPVYRRDCQSQAISLGPCEVGLQALVVAALQEEYCAAQQISVPQTDIDAFIARWNQRSREAIRARREEIKKELSADDTTEERKLELQRRLEGLPFNGTSSLPAFDAKREQQRLEELRKKVADIDLPWLDRIGQQRALRRQVRLIESQSWLAAEAYAQLLPLRCQKALYEKYGGKVVAMLLSISPIGAYFKLVQEAERSGKLEFLDEGVEQAVWRQMHKEMNRPEIRPSAVNFQWPGWLIDISDGKQQ